MKSYSKVANFIAVEAGTYNDGFEKELRQYNEGAQDLEFLFKKYKVPVKEYIKANPKGLDFINYFKNVKQLSQNDIRAYQNFEKELRDFDPAKRQIGLDETDLRGILRHIPTGAKVKKELSSKSLKLQVVETTSAPPLISDDVHRAATRLQKACNDFVNEVTTRVPGVAGNFDRYVHLEGASGKILFHYEFRIEITNKKHEKVLKKLHDAIK